MKKILITLLALGSFSSFAKSSIEYTCTSRDTNKEIKITSNNTSFGDNYDSYFTIWTRGLFPEFVGFDQDFHECYYNTERLEEGTQCKSISLAAGYDDDSYFIIKTDAKINENPRNFEAQLTDTTENKIYNIECSR